MTPALRTPLALGKPFTLETLLLTSIRARALSLTAGTALLLTACLNTTDPGDSTGFSYSLPSDSLTILVGTSTNTVITVARSGSFTGAVALIANNVPTGITVTLSPDTIQPGFYTSNMKIAVDSTLGQGTLAFNLRFSAAPNIVVNQPIQIALTVPGSFTKAASVAH